MRGSKCLLICISGNPACSVFVCKINGVKGAVGYVVAEKKGKRRRKRWFEQTSDRIW